MSIIYAIDHMKTVKEISKPMIVMYILLAIVAVIKMPLGTMLSPAITPEISGKYEYTFDKNDLVGFEYGLVTTVSDGDTIEINDKDKIRFLGIDTPELEHKQSNIKLECYGKDAETRMKQLALGKFVYLEKEGRNKDKYGRLLRNVFLPLNKEETEFLYLNGYMVGEGYARLYILEKKLKYKEDLAMYQDQAQEEKRGLWSACDREKFRW